jgi:hypothetical protein
MDGPRPPAFLLRSYQGCRGTAARNGLVVKGRFLANLSLATGEGEKEDQVNARFSTFGSTSLSAPLALCSFAILK